MESLGQAESCTARLKEELQNISTGHVSAEVLKVNDTLCQAVGVRGENVIVEVVLRKANQKPAGEYSSSSLT